MVLIVVFKHRILLLATFGDHLSCSCRLSQRTTTVTMITCKTFEGQENTIQLYIYGTVSSITRALQYSTSCVTQVLLQSQVICHQSQPQMVYCWCSAGLLHGLLTGYSWITQSLWPTSTPVWWLCSPPLIPASLSPETTSQHHHSVTSMCGVWLLSTQLVVVCLLTTPLLSISQMQVHSSILNCVNDWYSKWKLCSSKYWCLHQQ